MDPCKRWWQLSGFGRVRNRVLTPAQVAASRQRPEPATVLAAEFGVSPTAVQQVRRGETYRSTP